MTPRGLLWRSAVVYALMTAAGLAVMGLVHKNLAPSLYWPSAPRDGARLLAIGGLSALVLHVMSYFFEEWFASYRRLKALVVALLGPCSLPAAIYLSLATAFGEEILFRGALQPLVGLFPAALLFGLLHMGRDGLASTWSLWALLAGLLLGWVYQETASLWPPIIGHFLVNMTSILSLRRLYQRFLAHQASAAAESPGDLP